MQEGDPPEGPGLCFWDTQPCHSVHFQVPQVPSVSLNGQGAEGKLDQGICEPSLASDRGHCERTEDSVTASACPRVPRFY